MRGDEVVRMVPYKDGKANRGHLELRSSNCPSSSAVRRSGLPAQPAMSAWIDSNRSAKRRRRGRKTDYKPAGSVASQSTAPAKRSRRRKATTAAAPLAPAQPNSVTGTPLRISYGNKEVALKLGARYRSGGWYAPHGVDLSAFGERGWL